MSNLISKTSPPNPLLIKDRGSEKFQLCNNIKRGEVLKILNPQNNRDDDRMFGGLL